MLIPEHNYAARRESSGSKPRWDDGFMLSALLDSVDCGVLLFGGGGELRAANLYEVAYFLDQNAANDAFWTRWRDLHRPELRRLQALCFRLAAEWFDCRMSAIARTEVDLLPAPVQRWFERCAASPAEAFFRPNKDE